MLIFAMYFLLGCFAGTLSGLLGIGGGIIVVPGLLFLFQYEHVAHTHLMQLAAGTSLAIMVVTTLSSLISHRRRLREAWKSARAVLPGVIFGVLVGSVIADHLTSRTLTLLFAALLIVIAIHMLVDIWRSKSNETKQTAHLPGPVGLSAFGTLIGVQSGLLGIGGGVLTVPFFLYCGESIRTAAVVSIAVGLVISTIGSISYYYHGLGVTTVPLHSIGYIYLPAFISTALGTMLFAPFGAWLSHLLHGKTLRIVFACFLLVVSFKMWLG